MKIRRFLQATLVMAVACSLILMTASAAYGGIVNYCNVAGDNVQFENLIETSTGSGEMYGQPVAEGDSIVAPGTGFLSQSVAGAIDLVDGRLQMTITANDGFLFDEIAFSELGSFFGIGDDAFSLVNSFATIESADGAFTGGMTLSNTGTGQGGWSGDYTISFPETDQVTLTLNNQLLTSTGLTDAAFVEASSFRISLNAFNAPSVPEPTSMCWTFLAMIGLANYRRRNRS